MKPPKTGVCVCRHDLRMHLPDPRVPFAWPCKECECSEYTETETEVAA